MKILALLIGGAFAAPFIILFSALFRALFLFYPTMLVLGAVHSSIPMVPPLGWQASFWVVAALALLFPVGTSVKSE